MPFDGSDSPQFRVIQGLLKVRDGLESGWCQNQYSMSKLIGDGDVLTSVTAHCVVGWVRAVESVGTRTQRDKARNQLVKYLYDAMPSHEQETCWLTSHQRRRDRLIVYNDCDERQLSDMLNLCDRAISLAQKETV